MGFFFSKIWKALLSKRDVRILMVGLDAAGKTTILYQLKMGETVKTIPTIGFNVETLDYKGLNFTVWDVGGQDKIRVLWKHYYQNTDGLIFVVDSNDRDRIEDAAEELKKMLAEEELKDCAVLVMANKQDLNGALPPGVDTAAGHIAVEARQHGHDADIGGDHEMQDADALVALHAKPAQAAVDLGDLHALLVEVERVVAGRHDIGHEFGIRGQGAQQPSVLAVPEAASVIFGHGK